MTREIDQPCLYMALRSYLDHMDVVSRHISVLVYDGGKEIALSGANCCMTFWFIFVNVRNYISGHVLEVE